MPSVGWQEKTKSSFLIGVVLSISRLSTKVIINKRTNEQSILCLTRLSVKNYPNDNLPETDERPEIYEWTRRLRLMRRWADMLNKLGGDVTVVHLPEAGLHGNTHFPMSDLNNREVAELMYEWLCAKGLD